MYKTFEIEFESENGESTIPILAPGWPVHGPLTQPFSGQTNFIAAWNDVMEARRKQLKKLERIQEEMAKETFSAPSALAIRM